MVIFTGAKRATKPMNTRPPIQINVYIMAAEIRLLNRDPVDRAAISNWEAWWDTRLSDFSTHRFLDPNFIHGSTYSMSVRWVRHQQPFEITGF